MGNSFGVTVVIGGHSSCFTQISLFPPLIKLILCGLKSYYDLKFNISSLSLLLTLLILEFFFPPLDVQNSRTLPENISIKQPSDP